MRTGVSIDEVNLKHFVGENCIEFYHLESSESFRKMESFTVQLSDKQQKNQMQTVLQIVTGNLSDTGKTMSAYLLRKPELFHNDIFMNKKEVELDGLI